MLASLSCSLDAVPTPLIQTAGVLTACAGLLWARRRAITSSQPDDESLEWNNHHPEHQVKIARFVGEGDAGIDSILKDADARVDSLRAASGGVAGATLRADDADRRGEVVLAGEEREAIAKAIYDVLFFDRAITYAQQPAFNVTTGVQNVRLPPTTIAFHRGTCIDLVVLYLSLLATAGLDPVFIQLSNPKHAFAAMRLKSPPASGTGGTASFLLTLAELLQRLLNKHEILVLDCAAFSVGYPGGKLPFDQARAKGVAMLLGNTFTTFEFALDVRRAWLEVPETKRAPVGMRHTFLARPIPRGIARTLAALPVLVVIALMRITEPELPKHLNVLTEFTPSGWMGDGVGPAGSSRVFWEYPSVQGCDSAPCARVEYRKNPPPPDSNWAGMYLQYPAGNWGERAGRKLRSNFFWRGDYKRLTFWARADVPTGVEFRAGGIEREGLPHCDTFKVNLGGKILGGEWKKFEIDLTGANLNHVIGSFSWKMDSKGVFYLKDVFYEK